MITAIFRRHLIPIWVLLDRFSLPDDIAGVAIFLASALFSFVTETTIQAHGRSPTAGGWFRTGEGRGVASLSSLASAITCLKARARFDESHVQETV